MTHDALGPQSRAGGSLRSFSGASASSFALVESLHGTPLWGASTARTVSHSSGKRASCAESSPGSLGDATENPAPRRAFENYGDEETHEMTAARTFLRTVTSDGHFGRSLMKGDAPHTICDTVIRETSARAAMAQAEMRSRDLRDLRWNLGLRGNGSRANSRPRPCGS